MHTQKAVKCKSPKQSWFSYNLALQVEVRGVVLERCKSERQVGLSRVGVLQGVPENVAGAEKRAANLAVIAPRVFERGYSRAGDGALVGPASLGDPDGLSSRHSLGLSETSVEVLAGLLDGVGAGGLEVWEGVVAEPRIIG
jgi:hypothetical protein